MTTAIEMYLQSKSLWSRDKVGAITLGLTRKARTSMSCVCDISFEVDSPNIYVIETVHLCFLHMLRIQLEERFVRT